MTDPVNPAEPPARADIAISGVGPRGPAADETQPAEEMLYQAATIISDRRELYGPPRKSLLAIAERWSLTLGIPIDPIQVALCMIDLKVARATGNLHHRDSVVDIAGYAAILLEVVAEEE
jgi:hypothetical protein